MKKVLDLSIEVVSVSCDSKQDQTSADVSAIGGGCGPGPCPCGPCPCGPCC